MSNDTQPDGSGDCGPRSALTRNEVYAYEAEAFTDTDGHRSIRVRPAESAAGITRLSVNVNTECAAHLEAMKAQGVSATEVVRQALALHKCVRDGGHVVLPEEDAG